jgi:FMN reductase
MTHREHSLVAVSAGLSQPSATRLLADRLASATEAGLVEQGIGVARTNVELRDIARDLVDRLLTNVPSPRLEKAIDAVLSADAMVVVTPIFNGSYSGLFKIFFDVIERDALHGMPVLLGATGGTPRHSLAIDHALRPLFAYLGALTVPTGVFAATEDWGSAAAPTDAALADRIARAGRDLAAAVVARPHVTRRDAFADPIPFDELLRATPQD